MENNILITRLQKEILENFKHIMNNLKIYLFGSVLYSNDYHDVDILIVYNCLTYGEVIEIRNVFYEKLNILAGKDIDIVLLSEKEAISSNFIKEEGCNRIL